MGVAGALMCAIAMGTLMLGGSCLERGVADAPGDVKASAHDPTGLSAAFKSASRAVAPAVVNIQSVRMIRKWSVSCWGAVGESIGATARLTQPRERIDPERVL